MDGGAWQARVHRVARIWTQLKRLNTHTHNAGQAAGDIASSVDQAQVSPEAQVLSRGSSAPQRGWRGRLQGGCGHEVRF